MSAEDIELTPDALAGRATAFATLPDVYARIKQTLDDPSSTHADVAEVIGTDPALTARVMKIANSAFYSRPGTISKISQAIGLLGTQQVHDLVLATIVIAGTAKVFDDRLSLRRFWQHSLTLGSAAKLLAEECGILDAERVFVAGLISQLGQIVVGQALPEQGGRLRQQAGAANADLAAAQRQQLGFDHAAVAAALFSRWGLPPELIEPVHWHTRPELAAGHSLEASILHIAAGLAHAIVDNTKLEDLLAGFDETAWQTTGLTRERLQLLRDETTALTKEIAPILLDAAA